MLRYEFSIIEIGYWKLERKLSFFYAQASRGFSPLSLLPTPNARDSDPSNRQCLSWRGESNSRPRPYQGRALPTELPQRKWPLGKRPLSFRHSRSKIQGEFLPWEKFPAGEGNRTLVSSLEGSRSTIEPHPRPPRLPQTFWTKKRLRFDLGVYKTNQNSRVKQRGKTRVVWIYNKRAKGSQ